MLLLNVTPAPSPGSQKCSNRNRKLPLKFQHRQSAAPGCQATNQRPAVTGGHRNLRVVTSRIVTVDNFSRVDTCTFIRDSPHNTKVMASQIAATAGAVAVTAADTVVNEGAADAAAATTVVRSV